MSNSYLSDFKSISPRYEIPQKEARSWLNFAHGKSLGRQGTLDSDKLNTWISKYTVADSQIAARFTELVDFTRNSLDGNLIFTTAEGSELGQGLSERMKFFDKVVSERAEQYFEYREDSPHHMIHVSCTGYLSPSPLQRLCSKRGWHNTEITHAYHMGCYASMPSVRLADALSVSGDIDIFHSELCTLHFETCNFTPEQLIVQSLFADGYVGYKCTSKPPNQPSLRVLAITESRIAESEEDMTWVPSEKSFNMSISREVPFKLALNIHEGLETIFKKVGLKTDETMQNAIFAIHPGGPKILDQVAMLLNLKESQISESREVLRTKGNMSSATLPHIWKAILEKSHYQPGQKVVSLAFGPGLSLFGGVFEINIE